MYTLHFFFKTDDKYFSLNPTEMVTMFTTWVHLWISIPTQVDFIMHYSADLVIRLFILDSGPNGLNAHFQETEFEDIKGLLRPYLRQIKDDYIKQELIINN